MKKVKTLVTGSMLAMAAFGVIGQCVISLTPDCPKTIPGTDCANVTDSYNSAKEACVGENGYSPATYIPPECEYSCGGMEGTYYYAGIQVGTNSCPGDETSGNCGG